MQSVRRCAAAAAAAVLMTGCTGGASPSPGPTASSDATDPPDADPAAFCAMVTDEEMTAITGRPQTVSDGTGSGYRTSCNGVRDPEDELSLDWTRLGDPATLERELDSAAASLEPVDRPVAGSSEAKVFAGEIAGVPIVQVITPYDGAVLFVEARDFGSNDDDPIPPADMIDAAVGVAEAYLD